MSQGSTPTAPVEAVLNLWNNHKPVAIFLGVVIGLILAFIALLNPLFVVIFVVGIVVTIQQYQAALKRRNTMQVFAEQQGWAFTNSDDRWVTTFHAGPLGEGSDRSAHNVITGEFNGLPFSAFDYVYVTGSGKNRETHRVGVCLLQTGGWLPNLVLLPEGWGIKVFNGDNLDTESIEFNKKWIIQATDKRTAHAILNPSMLAFLLDTHTLTQGWWTELNVIGTYRKTPLQPDDIIADLEFLKEIQARIPRWVLEDSKGGNG